MKRIIDRKSNNLIIVIFDFRLPSKRVSAPTYISYSLTDFVSKTEPVISYIY